MKTKFVNSIVTILLLILPFFMGSLLAKHTPYIETNSFQTFLIIWCAFTLVFFTLSFRFVLNRMALPLFLIACPIIGIVGMQAPPDLSITVLKHPEREHLRYIFLFFAAFLFLTFFIVYGKSNLAKMSKTRRIWLTVLFVLSFVELIWEFTHHYSYPDALAKWVAEGKLADDFGKQYDNITVINMGVFGRLVQFTFIIWVSILCYNDKLSSLWSPILTILLSFAGIVSAFVVFFTEMNFPKGFEFLFLFFIPGIPFLILYWLGVALITKNRSLAPNPE